MNVRQESSVVRDPDGTVEFTVWFDPDGTVPLPQLVALIVAQMNAAQIRGVRGEFRHPFVKEYAE